jgi:P4 family phage/plasmid primase-like protien
MEYNAFRGNITTGLIETLAAQLSVTAESLNKLEAGFMCGGLKEDNNRISQHAFTFPEMDADGNVIGILRRFWDGSKFMVKGSERGLYYCNKGLFTQSHLPILVVEGASDTAAGLSLGFPTIGRPSAQGGLDLIVKLLKGHDISVVVVGENDPAGVSGMQSTHACLAQCVKSCSMLMPPEGIKDLRSWLTSGLTHEKLMDCINKLDVKPSTNILTSKRAIDLADAFVDTYDTPQGLLLRKLKGDYYKWTTGVYKQVDIETELYGEMHNFFRNKQIQRITKKGVEQEEFDLTTSKIRDIMAAMNTRCPVDVNPPGWLDGRQHPTTANVIAFHNGILDVEAYLNYEIKLIPPTPKFFNTSVTPFDFNPTAKCNRWHKFLEDMFGNDQERKDLLQEWFGYNVVADVSIEKMMILIGRSGAGKSTILDVLKALMGDQYCSISMEDMSGTFGLAQLIGKLAVIIGDGHVTAKTDAKRVLEVLKSVSGGDDVSINQKFKKAIGYKLHTRFTMAVNDMPDLKDEALTLRRRLLMIAFDKDFTANPDTSLKGKLIAEAPGIMLWALDGLRRLRKNGKFTEPKSCVHVKSEMERTNSPVMNFVHDCCAMETNSYVEKDRLYNVWKSWAKDQDMPWLSKQKFGRQLCVVCPTVRPDRRTLATGRVATYENIRLSDWALLNGV